MTLRSESSTTVGSFQCVSLLDHPVAGSSSNIRHTAAPLSTGVALITGRAPDESASRSSLECAGMFAAVDVVAVDVVAVDAVVALDAVVAVVCVEVTDVSFF